MMARKSLVLQSKISSGINFYVNAKKNNDKSKSNYSVSIIINLTYLILIIPAVFMMNNGLFCKYYSLILFTVYIFTYKIIYKKINDATKQAANDVFSNKVIAWYEGKSEVGPRALGHRSLVSNPTYKDNWKRVNKIKQREWWRPFAPSVLEEEADKWFENMPFPSPYMLFTGKVKIIISFIIFLSLSIKLYATANFSL